MILRVLLVRSIFSYDFRICIGMLTPANKFTPTRKLTTVSIVIIRRIILKTYIPTPFDGGVQPDAIFGRQPSLQRYLHYYTIHTFVTETQTFKWRKKLPELNGWIRT